jgi:hypothetical protein
VKVKRLRSALWDGNSFDRDTGDVIRNFVGLPKQRERAVGPAQEVRGLPTHNYLFVRTFSPWSNASLRLGWRMVQAAKQPVLGELVPSSPCEDAPLKGLTLNCAPFQVME